MIKIASSTMPKVSQEKGKVSMRAVSTLVFDPTNSRPSVSLYEVAPGKKAKKVWQVVAVAAGPGRVSYWPILLKKQKSFPSDQILVITGPGPFTATRAAVNIANALAYGWGRGVRGVSLDELKKKGLQKILSESFPATFDLKKRALPFYTGPAY
jgi:hypothetical protein